MNKILIGLTIIAVIVMSVFFFRPNSTGKVVTGSKVIEFNVTAFKFGYSPDEIIVNKGDKVRIRIENTDVLHGIRIPELGLRGNEVIEFTANETGEFTWYCTNLCGAKDEHMSMRGKLIIK